MEKQFISNTSKQLPRQFKSRDLPRGTHISTSKRLRLSDIKVKSNVECLPFEMNELLFNLNVTYNEKFDFNKKIEFKNLSNELVKELCKRFDLKLNSINITANQLVIEEHFKYDVYEMKLKPFVKLKYKSPVLFNAFCFFVSNAPMQIIDKGENEIYNDYTIECLTERMEDNIFKKEKREIKRAIDNHEQNKAHLRDFCSVLTKEEVVKSLLHYTPKNKLFQRCKKAFLNWIELDFCFMNSYPYQYYSKEEQEEGEEEEQEIKDYTDFMYFTYSDNKIIKEEMQERLSDMFTNSLKTNPCWIIAQDKEESNVQKSIRNFELFIEEYLDIEENLN